MQYKYALTLAATLALGGCLPSSDSGSDPVPSIQLAPALLDDGTQITYTPDDDRLFSASGVRAVVDDDFVSASFEDGQVLLSALDSDRPRQTVVRLRNADGDTLSFFEVIVNNASGEAIEAELLAWINQREQVLTLSEDFSLVRLISAVGYFRQEITATKQDQINQHDIESVGSFNTLQDSFNNGEETLGAYNASLTGEVELEQALDAIRQSAQSHQQFSQGRLSEAVSATSTFGVPAMALSYDDQNDTISSLIGNPEVGMQTDSGWVFDDNQTHLEVAVNLNLLAVCHGG